MASALPFTRKTLSPLDIELLLFHAIAGHPCSHSKNGEKKEENNELMKAAAYGNPLARMLTAEV